MDQQGLGLEAARLLVSKDWFFNGGMIWDFSKNSPECSIVATRSDGGSVIQQFPHLHMIRSPDQQSQNSFSQKGNTIMQSMGAVDFPQRAFIPQAR